MSANLTAIAAVDCNWGIGGKGDLLFALPTDMKFFRMHTLEQTIIMGRKTLDSFPHGKPLPKRRNIVLTHQETLPQEGVEIAHTAEEVLALVGDEPAFVIGGGTVYEALLPHCTKAYITKIQSAGAEVDTYFPNLDTMDNWHISAQSQPVTENGHTFAFTEYTKKANS